MHEVFADPTSLTQDFWSTLLYWFLVISVAAPMLWLAERGRPTSFGLPFYAVCGGLAFAAAALDAYWGTAGNFTAMTVSEGELQLVYASPFARTERVRKEDVAEVLAGSPGKGTSHWCYLKIVERTGTTHRSAARPGRAEACKTLRDSLLRVVKE